MTGSILPIQIRIDPKYFWPRYFDGPIFALHEEHQTEDE